jgi:polar amino acid transport system substrate-binding protein
MEHMLLRVAALILTLASCLQAQTAPLRVGMDLSYPPFETIGPDGKPSGISVDLARALGADLGRAVEIENIPFTGLIPALKSGKIDLIISSMTATPERSKTVAFSEPYLTTGLSALVPEASTDPEVVQGKADAFIYDQMSVFQNARRHPGKVRALLAPLQQESWAVALRPQDTELLAQVNAFLGKFRQDGGFDELANRYLADEKAAFAAQGIPFVF